MKTAGVAMKKRIAIWAGIGFAVSCCFVLFTFLMPPDYLYLNLRKPAVEAFALVSFPAGFAFRHVPLHFWWVPLIDAASYTVIGLMVEMLRRKLHFRPILAV
ncbi:MAG TPA: hypothetical protein VIJ01_12765 [Candidatus Angelobacter sp.]